MIFRIYNGISLQPYWELCYINIVETGTIFSEKYRNFEENTVIFVYTDNILIDRSRTHMYNRFM